MKTLIGILGEVPAGEKRELLEGERGEETQVTVRGDAGGKTLEAWLEELEKDKLDRLSRDIERRVSRL